MPLNETQTNALREQIIQWHQHHGRHDLPWQHGVTAYRVHVSEIMLQQTQVTTVIPYFERWMKSFPDLQSLASASEDDVMAHWQGLGYYSRARNLRKAAQHLVAEHGGQYPNELASLNAIPGVGRYTAGAIRSFAFNDYGPIVDGNVKRLYARLFGLYGEPTSSALNRTLWQYAEVLTPAEQSALYSQGVLDLGATLCKKSSPDCTRCPVQDACFAWRNNKTAELPSPKRRKTKPTKDAHFLWYHEADALLLEKRPSPGIWGALWCLPETSGAPANAALMGEFTHEFSHYRLAASVWRLGSIPLQESSRQQQLQPVALLPEVGLPSPIRQFINDLQALDKMY